MERIKNLFSLTAVMEEDTEERVFSGYIKEFPNVFAVGNSEKELAENLLTALKHALTYKAEMAAKQIQGGQTSAHNVSKKTERSITFGSLELA